MSIFRSITGFLARAFLTIESLYTLSYDTCSLYASTTIGPDSSPCRNRLYSSSTTCPSLSAAQALKTTLFFKPQHLLHLHWKLKFYSFSLRFPLTQFTISPKKLRPFLAFYSLSGKRFNGTRSFMENVEISSRSRTYNRFAWTSCIITIYGIE